MGSVIRKPAQKSIMRIQYRTHQARSAAAHRRAQAERDAGIPDREPIRDMRQPVELDLRSYGWRHVRIEPRFGYVACRVVDVDTGEVLHCAALKEALHWIADTAPRMLAARNFQ